MYGCWNIILGPHNGITNRNRDASVFLDNKINDHVLPSAPTNLNMSTCMILLHFSISSTFLKEIIRISWHFLVMNNIHNNRINEITPLVSYLDFPDSADFEGNSRPCYATNVCHHQTICEECAVFAYLCHFAMRQCSQNLRSPFHIQDNCEWQECIPSR
jgi:hypothetical protein